MPQVSLRRWNSNALLYIGSTYLDNEIGSPIKNFYGLSSHDTVLWYHDLWFEYRRFLSHNSNATHLSPGGRSYSTLSEGELIVNTCNPVWDRNLGFANTQRAVRLVYSLVPSTNTKIQYSHCSPDSPLSTQLRFFRFHLELLRYSVASLSSQIHRAGDWP